MREYLEATEIVEKEQEAEFIRSDVTGMTDLEKDDVQAEMEAIMDGKSYRLVTHSCYHKDGGACSVELIKEVS
jgi:hypothetical protein